MLGGRRWDGTAQATVDAVSEVPLGRIRPQPRRVESSQGKFSAAGVARLKAAEAPQGRMMIREDSPSELVEFRNVEVRDACEQRGHELSAARAGGRTKTESEVGKGVGGSQALRASHSW